MTNVSGKRAVTLLRRLTACFPDPSVTIFEVRYLEIYKNFRRNFFCHIFIFFFQQSKHIRSHQTNRKTAYLKKILFSRFFTFFHVFPELFSRVWSEWFQLRGGAKNEKKFRKNRKFRKIAKTITKVSYNTLVGHLGWFGVVWDTESQNRVDQRRISQ